MARIFLDFDRTLFDTNRFYNEHEKCLFETKPINRFTDSFKRFLYDDVVDFLMWCKENNHNCYLLTFGSRNVQEPKFKLCNIEKYFSKTFYMEQGSKVDAVYDSILEFPDEKIVFIDDTIEHLEAFHVKLPQSSTILMKRTVTNENELLKSPFLVISKLQEVRKYL